MKLKKLLEISGTCLTNVEVTTTKVFGEWCRAYVKIEFGKVRMQQAMPVVTPEMECQYSATSGTYRNNIDCFTSSGVTVSESRIA